MPKPHIHALQDVKNFGGVVDDYIEIHSLMDSGKGALADNRGRAWSHNAHFIYDVLPRIFGTTITNSDGKVVSVSQIGENHVLMDFRGKFIPTLQDWMEETPIRPWMNNASLNDYPPSQRQIRNDDNDMMNVLID